MTSRLCPLRSGQKPMGGRFKDGIPEYRSSEKRFSEHFLLRACFFELLYLISILMTPSVVFPLGLDSHWYRMG